MGEFRFSQTCMKYQTVSTSQLLCPAQLPPRPSFVKILKGPLPALLRGFLQGVPLPGPFQAPGLCSPWKSPSCSWGSSLSWSAGQQTSQSHPGRPPAFLEDGGTAEMHLLSQALPGRVRQWLQRKPKALMKERNVSETLGKVPRGGFLAHLEDTGSSTSPKRCPSLNVKCA